MLGLATFGHDSSASLCTICAACQYALPIRHRHWTFVQLFRPHVVRTLSESSNELGWKTGSRAGWIRAMARASRREPRKKNEEDPCSAGRPTARKESFGCRGQKRGRGQVEPKICRDFERSVGTSWGCIPPSRSRCCEVGWARKVKTPPSSNGLRSDREQLSPTDGTAGCPHSGGCRPSS